MQGFCAAAVLLLASGGAGAAPPAEALLAGAPQPSGAAFYCPAPRPLDALLQAGAFAGASLVLIAAARRRSQRFVAAR